MARKTSEERSGGINYSLRLHPNELANLEELAEEFGTSQAEVIRVFIRHMKTTFGLPAYVAERLREDMKARKLNMFEYLTELLHRRYEDLEFKKPGR